MGTKTTVGVGMTDDVTATLIFDSPEDEALFRERLRTWLRAKADEQVSQ